MRGTANRFAKIASGWEGSRSNRWILEGENGGQALVLRNPENRPCKARAAIQGLPNGASLTLWRPFDKERRVRAQPVSLTLRPHEAAVLISR